VHAIFCCGCAAFFVHPALPHRDMFKQLRHDQSVFMYFFVAAVPQPLVLAALPHKKLSLRQSRTIKMKQRRLFFLKKESNLCGSATK
jgi:hypothetical protein